MTQLNSNMMLALIIGILFVALIYYLNQNNDQPIQNDGTIGAGLVTASPTLTTNPNATTTMAGARPVQPPEFDNRRTDDMNDTIIDDLVAQYSTTNRPIDGGIGTFTGLDPMAGEHGAFGDYPVKKQLNFKKMEQPYSDDAHDHRDFSYKRKMFTRRTPEDIKAQFDVNKMLPQEYEEDWFDAEPLLSTKKIKGTHLIHPKVHLGVNTIQNSLKNATHDLRGDVAVPKIRVSPFNNSSIEPDTNLKGICNPI